MTGPRRHCPRVRETTASFTDEELAPDPGEVGTGLISTVAGVAVFLVLILLVSQLAFDLYARSAVSAVAFDAARIVAGADAAGSGSSVASAEKMARQELGAYGNGASFSWRLSPDQVQLAVTVRDRSLLPPDLVSPLGLDDIARTVVVRRERLR